MAKRKAKTIYCPKCTNAVMTYDGKSEISKSVKCKFCGSLVVYTPREDKATMENKPSRNVSSGMRFY